MLKSFPCPSCSQTLQAEGTWSGQQTQCPYCKNVITIPDFEEAGDGFDFQEVKEFASTGIKSFRTMNYKDLFPFHEIFSRKMLADPLVRFAAFFGLFPLFCLASIEDMNYSVKTFVYLMVFYFCMLWVFVFGRRLKVTGKLFFKGLISMLFTASIGVGVGVWLYGLPAIDKFSKTLPDGNLLQKLLYFCLIVGPVEELVKMLPIVLWGYLKQIKNMRIGIYLGMMSGLGFAFKEAFLYIRNSGSALEMLIQVFLRLICLSLLHGVWCGAIGYNFGKAKQENISPAWPLIVVAWGVSALLHGLYDTFAGRAWGIVFAAASIFLFTFYLSKAQAPENRNN